MAVKNYEDFKVCDSLRFECWNLKNFELAININAISTIQIYIKSK
jgi:hypothetical protein